MNLKTRAFDQLNNLLGPNRAYLIRAAWILTKTAAEGPARRLERLGPDAIERELTRAIVPAQIPLVVARRQRAQDARLRS